MNYFAKCSVGKLTGGLFVVKMHRQQYAGLLVLVVTFAHFQHASAKHIAVSLDAKWKSTPLLLEAR